MLLDLTHTSHTRSLTGIQRVARGLWRDLGTEAISVCHDPYARRWRLLEGWESAGLSAAPAGGRRRARWPLRARAAGMLERWGLRAAPASLPADRGGLLVPEIFSPAAAAALPSLLAAVPGPRAAIFYDAVALKLPEMTPAGTVARYPGYLCELLAFDGIAAISEDARDTLLDYWGWLGVPDHPPVAAIPLGVEPPRGAAPASDPGGPPVVLSVGTLEGRKNHLALLEACERLWAEGERFELRLVGSVRPETAGDALARLASLRKSDRPVRHDGVVDDALLEEAYASCAFTVYPSLMEGFGLPVAESLARGKPCVCSARGAVGETARGGGCLAADPLDAPAIASAIGLLLRDGAARERLRAEAAARPVRTSLAYARDLAAWMRTLSRRNFPPSNCSF